MDEKDGMSATESKDGEVLIQVSDNDTSKIQQVNTENGINKAAVVKYNTLITQLKFLTDSLNNV